MTGSVQTGAISLCIPCQRSNPGPLTLSLVTVLRVIGKGPILGYKHSIGRLCRHSFVRGTR